MLNIGQIVYDTTNHRVIMFAGVEMLQNQKTGKCHSESAFVDGEGNYMLFGKDKKTDFEYTNLTYDGKPWVGSAIRKLECGGCYFGILDGEIEEVITAAKEAIAEAKQFINEHGGLRVYKKFSVSMSKVHPQVEIKG